jgi:hypothetical protein
MHYTAFGQTWKLQIQSTMLISHTILSSRLKASIPYLGIFAASTVILLVGLISLGGFSAEYSGVDEAAHLVSGIMVYQYLLHGLPDGIPPLAFAQDYYDHYPKVAIGHWPPVFYAIQAIWFLIVGLSRASAIVLSAMIAGSLAVVTAWSCRTQALAWPLSMVAGLVVTLLPQTVASSLELSSDPLVALLSVMAAIVCQRWLSNLELSWGIGFAFLASVAVLVKGNAFPLFLLPGLILFRSSPLRSALRPAFWVPILLMVSLSLPWYVYQRELAVAEIVPGTTKSLSHRIVGTASSNSFRLFQLAGPLLSVLALLSVVPALGAQWMSRSMPLAVLPFAFWFFLSFLSPHGELRLMLAVAPVICLAAAISLRRLPVPLACLILLTGLATAHYLRPMQPKPQYGWVPAMAIVRSLPIQTYFVASNRSGEGAAISELALFEPQPRSTVLRATKLLQRSNWMGGNLRILAHTEEDVHAILFKNQVDSVLLDIDPGRPISEPLQLLANATADWPVTAKFNNIKILSRPR